jgi:hypothetical protein
MTEDETVVRTTKRYHEYTPALSALRSVLTELAKVDDSRKTLDLGWVNIYTDGSRKLFGSKKDADTYYGANRIACVRIPPIEYTPGEGI